MGAMRKILHMHKKMWEIEVILGTFTFQWDTGVLKAGFDSLDS